MLMLAMLIKAEISMLLLITANNQVKTTNYSVNNRPAFLKQNFEEIVKHQWQILLFL